MATVGPLEIRNPVILASGVLGDAPENLRAAYDMGAGVVVTKTITLEPREGYPGPTIKELDDGWTLNWVGLKNPGAKEFADMLGRPDYPVIVSLTGSIPSDFGRMVGMFDGVVGFELNISCPNVAGMGDYIGHDPVLTTQVVEAAKRATDLPVFVKVSNTMDAAVQAAIDAGADGITAINTVPGMHVDIKAEPPLVRKGGLSGHHLLPIALGMVKHIVSRYKVPVMGCGGVSTWQDAAAYLEAGAAAVQIGTAAMNDMSVLERIASRLAGREKVGQVAGSWNQVAAHMRV